MKKIMLLMLLPMFLFAQVTKNGVSSTPTASGAQLEFEVKCDSLNIYYTNAFSLGGYDLESFSSYPVYYSKILTSLGTPRVSAVIQGAMGTSTGWAVIDTVVLADSTKTVASGSLDMNNGKYSQYRLKVYGATGNRKDAVYKIILYKPWKR